MSMYIELLLASCALNLAAVVRTSPNFQLVARVSSVSTARGSGCHSFKRRDKLPSRGGAPSSRCEAHTRSAHLAKGDHLEYANILSVFGVFPANRIVTAIGTR